MPSEITKTRFGFRVKFISTNIQIKFSRDLYPYILIIPSRKYLDNLWKHPMSPISPFFFFFKLAFPIFCTPSLMIASPLKNYFY